MTEVLYTLGVLAIGAGIILIRKIDVLRKEIRNSLVISTSYSDEAVLTPDKDTNFVSTKLLPLTEESEADNLKESKSSRLYKTGKLMKLHRAINLPETADVFLHASSILEHVKQMGLAYNTLTIKTKGDTVTLAGSVKSQEDSEKIALAVANVEGVSAIDNQLAVEQPAVEARYYTVKSGDSLSKIAKEVYGDPLKYGVIFEANKPMLKDPDILYPDQVLRIPDL